jgi:hypothetical protein
MSRKCLSTNVALLIEICDGYILHRMLLEGMQSKNGSLVYCLPSYDPSAFGTLVGANGQCFGQQQYFPSLEYVQVCCGSEAFLFICRGKILFMDATLVREVPNGTTIGFVNTQCASSWTIFSKSNGITVNKFSKSIPHTTLIRTLNRVLHFLSNLIKSS